MNTTTILQPTGRPAFLRTVWSWLRIFPLLALLLPRLVGAQNFIPADTLTEEAEFNVDPRFMELEGNQLGISGDTIALAEVINYAIQVYTRSGTNWTHQAELTNTNFPDAISLTVAIDDDTIITSPAPTSREAEIFVRNGTNWTQQATLTSADEFFGDDVCISGNTAAVGASAAGSVTIFVRSGTNWTQQARIVTNVRQSEGGVALDGDTLAIADNSYDHGATFIFTRSGTNWTQQTRVSAVDGANFAVIRRTVSLTGDTLAVGDPDGTGTHSDRVYVFTRSGTSWTFQAKLQPPGGQAESDFGRRLSLQGNTLVVGADADSRKGVLAGAVHIFGRSGTNWSELADMAPTPSSGVTYQQFGFNVGLDGDTVAIWSDYANAPLKVYVPDYVAAALNDAPKLLYYTDAGAAPYTPEEAAFRYKDLLYEQDTNGVSARFDKISSLYGGAERQRAQWAENWVVRGLQTDPSNVALGNLLLDIYYDRTVAETISENNLLAKAEVAHFPSTISDMPTPSSGFVIDNEIQFYEQALATNRLALSGYFSLLTNDLGMAGSPPLGYQIFTGLVPARGLMPAMYYDTNGLLTSVTSSNAMLFSGYKDVVLLFNQLESYGDAASTLGKLLLARDGTSDRSEASNVVGQVQQTLFLDGTLLKSLFAALPGTNDPSGLAQSMDGWSASLTALNTLDQNLKGGANLLGFADDFMFYVDSLPGEANNVFNSYDAIYGYLNPGDPANSSHPLALAISALQAAENSYVTYLTSQDQLKDQIITLDQSYENRLREIVGAFPGDATYGNNPTNNPGSLLDQQYLAIQEATLKIKENQTKMSNLRQAVQIEINRSQSVSNVVINFGNKNAQLTEEIGLIDAGQAALGGFADSVNNIAQISEGEGPIAVKFVERLGALNAVAQFVGEIGKSQLEAEKERNSAMEQATVTGINSAAAVKSMLLDMNTLLVESQETALDLQQAVNQLTGLYREKQQLEDRVAQQNADLATRYYADPIHRWKAQADMGAADLAFNNAQRWLFFMDRALDYKWNMPFNHYYGSNTWTDATLYKLRNADELSEMFNAMNDWDVLGQNPTQSNVDYFSVRDDFFGYAPSNTLGQAMTYADPITGQTVSAIQAFRDRLRLLLNSSTPNNSYIDLHFSTVRQIPGQAFFLGPVFNTNGTVVSRGLALDKIKWIKINLPGANSLQGTYLSGNLTYGGTSFIRNLKVGTYDLAQPDHLINEMTAYSTRRYYFSMDEDKFKSEDALVVPVSMDLTKPAGQEPFAEQINAFDERSVATSDWELTIPTTVTGVPKLSIDELDDIEIWFNHVATARNP